jgi:hypothetical protein
MKTTKLFFLGAIAAGIFITACQRTEQKELPNPQTSSSSGDDNYSRSGANEECNPAAYSVVLEHKTLLADGTWEWLWSIQNSNPGSGNNGTSQDLSNWGMQFGACFDLGTIVNAAYSGNGTAWTNFSPTYGVDPSQGCLTSPVLKFDFGTTSSAKSYYKLVVSQDYIPYTSQAYYKSGSRTGCCTFLFMGIGCPGGQEE